jgi:hypothetical protein
MWKSVSFSFGQDGILAHKAECGQDWAEWQLRWHGRGFGRWTIGHLAAQFFDRNRPRETDANPSGYLMNKPVTPKDVELFSRVVDAETQP